MRDKVVVVTGAGSGIGRATALAFANQGARIAACDVDQARLDSLARELGDRALLVRKVDVSSRTEMSAFADAVHALVPAADVIINNAGVGMGGNFLDTSLDDWDWLLGVNLKGVIHGCHYFLPKMVARRQGHVVNLASILGIFAAPKATAYVASKFAVLGFSKSLRGELEPHGIGVTAICPGLIATAIMEDGRTVGGLAKHQDKIRTRFRTKGIPPERVAATIVEAVRTNAAVRTVGSDARAIAALSRLAPRVTAKIGSMVARRMGV